MRPAPGPLARVNLRDPQAAVVLDAVRRRVATWADPALALRRAGEAARLSLELLCRGSMVSALGAQGTGVLRVSRLPEDRPLWILGDIRGDVLALATALAFIDEADGRGDRAFVALLGDWTGGVAGDAACAAMVLERFNAAPDRTLLVRGDREWASDVQGVRVPSGLHAMPVPEALCDEHAKLLRQVRSIAERLPALVVLQQGVALAHGSLPRLARLAGLASAEAIEGSDAALRDCTIGRVHPSEPRVAPGDREGGALLGSEDFSQSAEALSRILALPVTRLVRGHDGVPEGFRWFRHCGEGALLTLTTMADKVERAGAMVRRCPCVARLKGGVIRVVRLEIPEEACFLCEQLFPKSRGVGSARGMTRSGGADEAAAARPTVEVGLRGDASGFAEPAREAGRAAKAAVQRPPDREPDRVESREATERGTHAPTADAKPDAASALAHFDRGVRLLGAKAWGGAVECFRLAASHAPLRDGAMLNESVALLWMGPARHQEALARLRELLRRTPHDESALLNLGIALLAGERNPIEACRVLRQVTEIAPEIGDAWWALGLAMTMRSDAAGAAGAFARATDAGCPLPAPGSLHGLVPARELEPALDALRGMARHRVVGGGRHG